ncbi:acyltransferase [Ferruginibacter paludis]|uniref:acyltransferase n=1 Tax=Ferruginibacter paludis TaxID=1310417 RepID=UPI0025B3142F|nr:acyltransferase [Ferruginibacter paludis]MDN3658903.1 acyltransferase [Ferruginibacter paludis]
MNPLTNRILKGLYFRITLPFRLGRLYYKRLFKFILPNFQKIIRKDVIFKDYPVCNQKILVSGNGKVSIGTKCSFGYKLGGNFHRGLIEIQPRYTSAEIVIGDNVNSNNNLILCAAQLIEIGNDTLIGQGVSIIDHEGHGMAPDKRGEVGEIGKVIIGRNVWIGNNVTILKNSEIGDNTIVGAGAIVTGKFPANVIIGGVPAKIIRQLYE